MWTLFSTNTSWFGTWNTDHIQAYCQRISALTGTKVDNLLHHTDLLVQASRVRVKLMFGLEKMVILDLIIYLVLHTYVYISKTSNTS